MVARSIKRRRSRAESAVLSTSSEGNIIFRSESFSTRGSERFMGILSLGSTIYYENAIQKFCDDVFNTNEA